MLDGSIHRYEGFSHEAVKLKVDVIGYRFTVNGQCTKLYHGTLMEAPQEFNLAEPVEEIAQVAALGDPVLNLRRQMRKLEQMSCLLRCGRRKHKTKYLRLRLYVTTKTNLHLQHSIETLRSLVMTSVRTSLLTEHSVKESESSYNDAMIVKSLELPLELGSYMLTVTIEGARVSECMVDSGA